MTSAPRPLIVAAEVSLALVTLAAAAGMSRLFDSSAWVGPVMLNALAAHVVVTWLRRRRLPLPVVGGLTLLAGGLAATWALYWSTTLTGLPTSETWSVMTADLGDAWTLYRDVVAPAPVEQGFVLASCLALWVIAYLADWAAFRLWVPFEACLPAGTLFIFTALLGAPGGRSLAVALFGAALLAFLLIHRLARQDASGHWVGDRRTAGHRSLLTAGAGLGVIAVLAGTLLGPSVPGARSPGLLDPSSLKGGDTRVTLSPLVDIRARLVSHSTVEVFTVRSPQRSYWRLTSLDRFDGRIWSSSGSFGRVGRSLPRSVAADVSVEAFDQTFAIGALSTIWLPTAYEPRAVAADGVEIRYDESSSTLIVGNDERSSDGLTYTVTSTSPRISADDLSGLAADVPDDIRDDYLDLPDDFSVTVRELAKALTVRADGPAEQARALQDYLRTFEYSLDVQPGHGDSDIEDFLLVTKVGYCEQFAGAFAAMGRSLGLPTRVAVGFTPGDEVPGEPGLYRVRGEYAHAWPEVYIAGAGWVAYEPTPGRGIPNAEGYTGVPDQQAVANDPNGSVSPTTIPGNTLPTAPSTTVDPTPVDVSSGGAAGAGDPTSSEPVFSRLVRRPIGRVAPAAGGAALAYILLVPIGLLIWRRLRRRRATTPLAKIDLAWRESVESAAGIGFTERPSDTHTERAHELATALPAAEAETMALAAHLEAAAYSAVGASDADVAAAQAAAEKIRAAARARVPWTRRARRWFDPRATVRAWRHDRRAGRRRITLTARGDLEQERELVGSGDRRSSS